MTIQQANRDIVSHYFIADCHLSPDQPETVDQFYLFLQQHKSSMDSLTILGDFFEVWIGDDSLNDWSKGLFNAIKATQAKVQFIAGNRDFLLSKKLLRQFNIGLLADNSIIYLNSHPVLIAHGDQFCTDDLEYAQFRKLVRSQQWQADFLSKPLAERQAIVSGLRKQSKHAMKNKQESIMDVNTLSITQAFESNQVNLIIHGHTHREQIHAYGNQHHRIVLPSWHNGMGYLKYDSQSAGGNFLLQPSGASLIFNG